MVRNIACESDVSVSERTLDVGPEECLGMPTIDQLSKLFKAIAAKDFLSSEQLARQIAAEEEKKGHRTAAQLLKGSLVTNGAKPVVDGYPAPDATTSQSFLMGALSRQSSSVTLRDVRMGKSQRASLEELVKEYEQQALLKARGIHRRTKLILHGPPGCGKSMAARALANEMKLPLFVVRFDSVIGAYLGQTAIHLRQLFHFAEVNQCVLLFDEIDALGKRRGSLTDVGELDRVVIALMQELELSELQGFIVATSNLPATLDSALWRRFHLSVELPRPRKREILEFARAKAGTLKIPMSESLQRRVAGLRNYADAEVAVENEARRLALSSL